MSAPWLGVMAMALVASVGGCRRMTHEQPMPDAATATPSPSPSPSPSRDSPPSLDRFLPDAAGAFVAGPLVEGPGFFRREYHDGAVRIDVTLARRPMTSDAFEAWTRGSEPYPVAALDVPPGSSHGFYDCSGAGDAERCSLHVQLRAGVHVEVMGNGTARRADVERLAAALPLRALTATGSGAD